MNIAIGHNFNEMSDSRAVADYVGAFSRSSRPLISNLHTQIEIIKSGSFNFPLTINRTEYDNSYVCSPFTALVPYALQEINKVDNRLFRYIIKSLIPVLSIYLKRNHVNQLLSINNWMLSTNLYGEYSGDGLPGMTSSLIKQYPDYALMFRSLNKHSNKSLMHKMRQCGYLMLPSRQVYIFDPACKVFTQTQNYKYDCQLLNKTALTYVSEKHIKKTDIKRIVELYNLLYIEKYSVHNPKFTESYVQFCLLSPLFYVEGFRNSGGELDAVGIRFIRGNIITLPIVGYDTAQAQAIGLYRLVMISTLKWAQENNKIFNASSGAPHFKRLRGAVPHIEYSAIYIHHLSKKRQRMWRYIAYGLERFIVPAMKKYQL